MHATRIVFVLLVGFVILVSFQCQRKEDVPMSTEANKALVRRLIDEAWNGGKLDVIDEILSPDYHLHIAVPGARTDREGYREVVATYRAAFPDFRFTIEDMVAEGDRVVIRCTMGGTHEGEYMGVPPTGKKLTLMAISIRRFEEGRVVEEWVESDMMGFMQKMGVVPGSE